MLEIFIVYILGIFLFTVGAKIIKGRAQIIIKILAYSLGFLLWLFLSILIREYVSVTNVGWVFLRLIFPVIGAVYFHVALINALFKKFGS